MFVQKKKGEKLLLKQMSRTSDPFKSEWGNINRHTNNQQQPDSYK